ncbi:MAG: LysR substrate-binding domain-containing protein [Clostridium sp.]
MDQHLASCRCCLSPVLEISDTAFIIQMLEQSRGLSFLPLFAVQKQIWEGTLAAVEVDDVEISMYRQIFYHKISSERGKWSSSSSLRPRKKTIDEKLIP